MSEHPYERFSEEELVLRDHLAIDRTVLANERTLLAYLRTGLALMLTGTGCIRFFTALAVHAAGYLIILLGIFVSGVGFQRYRKMDEKIKAARSPGGAVQAGKPEVNRPS